jgi:pyruvate dehydrogenase E2 component (dihydrolipoamide acetyltransferase)
MTEVIMPKMGDGMEEGTLLEWLKKDGDKVTSGEVIGTIQTDKATLELEAPGTGVLTGILLKGGETVPVGVRIAAILRQGETLPDNWGGASGLSSAVATTEVSAVESTVAESSNGSANGSSGAAVEAKSEGRIKASPLARKIAEQLGIDLHTVKGTGPGGRIIEQDVRSSKPSALEAKPAEPVAPVVAVQPFAPVVADREDKSVTLSRLRQITAKRTTESKQQVPHFYVTVEVDLEQILALRQMFERDQSGKVSINDFVVKACALALRDMPVVNSIFQGDKLVEKGGVHVGIAVALDDGLTVPVIKGADGLSLRQISARARELAQKARDNKLSMDELTGSTFAISNMGMLEVDNFIAIINQPNSAIIAIASVRKRAVVDEKDQIVVRSRMNITGSFDHRVVDGAIGAKFINLVRTYLENPTRLLS